MDRRVFGMGLAATALSASHTAHAQSDWPTKPIRVIVPYSAGGAADGLARLYFGRVSERLGQPVIIENKGGGGGTIGALAAAKADPDGSTFLYDATAFSVNPSLLPSLPYDPAKDFQPVFLAARLPNLLVVHPSVNAASVADVISEARRQGSLDWGSAGNGSVQHLSLELFRSLADIKINHIPYKGGAPALSDLIGGHLKFLFSNTAAATPHVQAGRIKAIAHTGVDRLAAFPELPAVSDTLPGCVAYEWNGIFAPARTPAPIIERLNAVLNDVQAEPAIAKRLADLSVLTQKNTPADFAAFVAAETVKWGKVVRDANIKPE
ncbi:MAG: tripartite tricarboxylate transporter substrate binding protein [Proteobacteria bacterium]|nr:tripartite tricarboxylate transporter substrate binding protein [Pseudomonadota bacterium]